MESGYIDTLTLEQSEGLNELKNMVKGSIYEGRVNSHPEGDRFLLRMLRATMKDKSKRRIFKPSAAKERLFRVLDWKQKYQVDIDNKPEMFEQYLQVYPSHNYRDYTAETIVWIRKCLF